MTFRAAYPQTSIHLTTLQRELLGYLETVPEGESVDELAGIYAQQHDGCLHQVREATTSLWLNGLVGQGWDRSRGNVLGLTEAGAHVAAGLKTWFGGEAHCPACVRLPCVCSVSIGCLVAGSDHTSLGCHGTHD